MPTFDTPQPIVATIELVIGDARLTAGDRSDTVVEVRPSDPSNELDVRAAEQTRVEFSAATGHLLVRPPRQRGLNPFGKVGSVDVTIELPAGSQVDASGAMAAFRLTGRLGECRLKTSAGDIQVDEAGRLDVRTGSGAIVVDHVAGDAEISTGSGQVRVREIDGSAVIKNSNGDTWVGEVSGDLRVNAANGDIAVDRAHADVNAATANGDVRLGEVVRGLGLAQDRLRPGRDRHPRRHRRPARRAHVVRPGAQPDGHRPPAPTDETVEVRARTGYGDIVIRRSPTGPEPAEGGLTMTTIPDEPAIAATGLRKSYGDKVVLDGIDLNVAEGTIFALLGPNGAGKTTMVQILSTLIGADGGEVAGRRPRPGPRTRRGARRDRRHRPVLGGGQPAHRRGEPDPDGRPAPPGPGRGPAAGRRAARAVRPGRRGEEAGRDLLRRHAAPARPRDDPGRRPADHLPRRADHRPRPAQPPHHVADHPRPRRRRRHDLPDHAVPGGGRPARRPDRRARPRPAGRRGHRGRAQAAHPRRPHPAAVRRREPARSGRPGADRCHPRRRRADPAGAQRRRRPVAARAARPARRRLDRGRRAVGPHPGPRRRLPRPHRPPTTTRTTEEGAPCDDHHVQRRERLGDDAAAATCGTSCATRR